MATFLGFACACGAKPGQRMYSVTDSKEPRRRFDLYHMMGAFRRRISKVVPRESIVALVTEFEIDGYLGPAVVAPIE